MGELEFQDEWTSLGGGRIRIPKLFVYSCYGLALIFQPGKSEAVLAFHGVGPQAARKEAFSEKNGVLECAAVAGT